MSPLAGLRRHTPLGRALGCSAAAVVLVGRRTAVVVPGRSASTASTPLRLAGKGAIVTGGGTGIGRGVALALAAEGCDVVITGRRPAPLDETVQEAARRGLDGSVRAFPVDAADQDQTPLVRHALEAFDGKLVRPHAGSCAQAEPLRSPDHGA